MTDPEKKGQSNLPPQGNAPSWIDEVLSGSREGAAISKPPAQPPLSGPQDLRLPEAAPTPTPPAFDTDDWVARATGGQAKDPRMPGGPAVPPRPTPSSSEVLSDFARQLSGESPRPAPPAPVREREVQTPPTDFWGDPVVRQAPVPYQQPQMPYAAGDVSQKKLIAGLLAIFLGSLGVHKFYLGMNQPGIILLGVNLGVWVVAILLGLLMFVVGLALTIPVAMFVSSILAVLGLVEGIIYLTKSDSEFEREYLVGQKPWL